MKIKQKIDQIEDIRIADSFVKYNKIGGGHGEARLYVGSLNNTKQFFSELYNIQMNNAFVLKQDFLNYLHDSEFEYKDPTYDYDSKNDLENNYIEYMQRVNDLKSIEFFTIGFALDKNPKGRCYIRTTERGNAIYTFLREMLLPEISKMSIVKILTNDNQIKYWFIPRVDIQYNKYNQLNNIKRIEKAINENKNLKETTKLSIIQARLGQGKFRGRLIEEMVACPVTLVDDTRLLLASHIKPWSVSNNEERLDHYNGLLLTPTFDRLFDQGLITFEKPNEIKYSPYLSDSTIEKLKLNEYIPNIIHFDKREKYIKYHINNIFKNFK